jgi:pyruvate formate lyase activating enzyme
MRVHLDPRAPWSYVRGLEPVSFCDWPGRIVSVLFLGGCNLRCPTCHNRSLALRPETLAPIPRQEIFRLLQARQGWIDGLVITGGEPTTVPGLKELLGELADLNFPMKLDTNGLEPETIKDLIKNDLVQAFAVDVKGPWRKYPELTGGACSPDQARRSLETIFGLAVDTPERFRFRLTEVPALTAEDIVEAEACLPEGFTLQRQSYRPVPDTSEANPDTAPPEEAAEARAARS